MLNKKALAASVSAPLAIYPEDVFQTYLYTGNDSTQTITNNIDLSGKGGLVWIKARSTADWNHCLYDTVRGATKRLSSNTTDAESTQSAGLTSFNNNGFTLGSSASENGSPQTQVSWTFREQAKFFDVVTYTGNGSNRTIAHNLGSTPGMIIVKRTDSSADWQVYHRSLTSASYRLMLNLTDAQELATTAWNSTAPTSTVFSLGTNSNTNANGGTYVAYLFAHDAGGFGDAGTDNIISCGSYTGNGSTQSISLGYEPQYILFKNATSAASWYVVDIMRGLPTGGSDQLLIPNLSAAELTVGDVMNVNATGFDVTTSSVANTSGQTYIYMAIRRPMKTPTSGTEVFSVTTGNFTTPKTVTTNFPVDLCYSTRTGAGTRHFNDRLRGGTTTAYRYLATNTTDAEATGTSAGIGFDNNTAIIDNDWVTGADAVWWNFKRAPGFFDQVCYTGTGTTTTQTHNLGVAPEMMIIKRRSGTGDWFVYSSTGIDTGKTYPYPRLNGNEDGWFGTGVINATAPTSSVFTISSTLNNSASTYVAYLFATLAGVSKVGSYTGTGSTQTINCGFSAGARFVMIKRTDSTGDWYIYDTARGIVSGNDPFLLANTSTAQTTNTDYIDPANSGFEISSTAPDAINANGGSFIFMAIA